MRRLRNRGGVYAFLLWWCCVIAAVSLPMELRAQGSLATLSGAVMDPSGAVVPGVKISLVRVDTNARRQVVSNSDGFFVIPQLDPGKYILQAYKDGFAIFEVSDIVLNVNDRRDLQIRLKVGTRSESVTVKGDPIAVNTSPAVATTIDSNFVSHMPLNGRTLQSLIALAPGTLSIVPGGVVGSGANNDGQISVNGMRESSNYMTVDGVSANIETNVTTLGETNGLIPGFGLNGTTINLVSADDLQELKVQTSNYSAENGRQPGGQFQLVTKSGTNQWHGSVYEYFRNDYLDAANWFVPAGAKKPALRFSDFGATLGGPIWKNRTFFFFSYEGNRLRLPQTTTATTASRQLRQTAAPALQPFVSVFGQPTGPDNPDGLSAPWVGSYSNPQNQDAMSIRIDHDLNSKVRLFMRYNYSPQDLNYLYPMYGYDNFRHGTTRTWTAGADITFSQSLVNQFRFNSSRSFIGGRFEFLPSVTAPPSSSLLIPPLTKAFSASIFFYFAGGVFYDLVGNNMVRPQMNLNDTLSKLWGNHLLKFGVDYNGVSSTYTEVAGGLTYYYTSLASAQSGVSPLVYYTNYYRPWQSYLYPDASAFAQDTWKVTPRLTLDYGVRWDLNPPVRFSPATYFVQLDWKNPAHLAPLGTPIAPTVWTAFAPRVGGSYVVSNRNGYQLVLRGGYGLFWDPGSIPPNGGPYFPEAYSTRFSNVAFPASSSMLAVPPKSIAPPYGGNYQGNFQVIADPGYSLPRVHQWNVALEQTLGSNQKLSVTYVGNAGRNLVRGAYLNPLSTAYPISSPDFSPYTGMQIYSTSPGHSDSSNYDALQVQFTRRSRSVNAIVNYTWSHAFDTSSGPQNFTAINWLKYSPSQDYASSDFDRRHIISGALNWNLPSMGAGNGGFHEVAHAVTKGWEFDSIVQYNSAAPLTVMYYDYTSGYLVGQNAYLRPDENPGVPAIISSPNAPGGVALNPAAFSIPNTLRQGNESRNAIRGFNFIQADIAFGRTFSVNERFHVQFRAEAFNFLNHPNFTNPYNYMGYRLSATKFVPNTFFGRPLQTVNNSTTVSPIFASGGPRDIQLSLKISF